MIIKENEKLDVALLSKGMKIYRLHKGERGEPFHIFSFVAAKYGETIIKATNDINKFKSGNPDYEFKFPSHQEYELEELSIDNAVVDESVNIQTDSLLQDTKKEKKDDEWTEQEIREAKERIMQKSQDKVNHSDNLGGIFKEVKTKIDYTEPASVESLNGDLFAVSSIKKEEVKPVEDSKTSKEDWGEISDYKSNLKGIETLIRVIHCDSLNSNKYGLRSLPSKVFDCSIVDPPYGMAFRSNTRKKENRHMKIENDDTVEFIPDFLKQLNRVTKDDSFIYIFFSHHYIDYLITEVKKVFGDGYKGILVWEKNNTTAGDLDVWGSQTEFILFIKKGSKSLTEVRDGNVFKFSKVISDNHPTEKPLDLIQYLLHNSCKPGEMVLDCFAGSGVLAEAALYESVNCVVMEYEKKYYSYICHRISDAMRRPKLLMDAFSDGIDNRTDKYIKIMEASYEQKLRDALDEHDKTRLKKLVELIEYELKSGHTEVIPYIIKLF